MRASLSINVALLCLLTGCSSFRTEWGAPMKAESHDFVEGSTPVETVIRELGPPSQVSALPDGFAFLYEHTIVKEYQVGINLNESIIKYFKFVHAWNDLDQQLSLLVFDNDGVLRSVDSEEWQEKLGGGSAVQFLFAVMSLTDDSAFRGGSPQHEWGRLKLQPPPVLVNSEQSLRSGEHGLQLRLAPAYAGQHTLEMTKPNEKKKKRRSQSASR